MIKAIYFDLFFTLIVPAYEKTNNEYDIINLSVSEWEQYAENEKSSKNDIERSIRYFTKIEIKRY